MAAIGGDYCGVAAVRQAISAGQGSVGRDTEVMRLGRLLCQHSSNIGDQIHRIEAALMRLCGGVPPMPETPTNKMPERAGALGEIEDALDQLGARQAVLVHLADVLERVA